MSSVDLNANDCGVGRNETRHLAHELLGPWDCTNSLSKKAPCA